MCQIIELLMSEGGVLNKLQIWRGHNIVYVSGSMSELSPKPCYTGLTSPGPEVIIFHA